MILLLRLLPLLVALFQGACFVWQKGSPETYPFLALVGVAMVPVASGLLAFRRISFLDLLEKMTPTFVLLCALAFGLSLAEGTWAVWTIAIVGGVASFLSLELLFLNAYKPAAYPMNGLSRVNIAYVPIAIWYVASTTSGYMMFVHTPWFVHVGVLSVLGGVLFRTTGHPGASLTQNILWTMIGVIAGAEIGWIGLMLPLSMEMQGIVAALLFTGILRMRRYLYDPKPSKRMALAEAIGLCVFFLSCIVTAKWL